MDEAAVVGLYGEVIAPKVAWMNLFGAVRSEISRKRAEYVRQLLKDGCSSPLPNEEAVWEYYAIACCGEDLIR